MEWPKDTDFNDEMIEDGSKIRYLTNLWIKGELDRVSDETINHYKEYSENALSQALRLLIHSHNDPLDFSFLVGLKEVESSNG